MSQRMLKPGPDHPITIAPAGERIRICFAGQIVAESADALVLREASYPPVYYLPRADARMPHFAPSEKRTYCPYKGDCSYFSLQAGGEIAENAVWSYERPYEAVAEIAGHLAFYPEKVEIRRGD